MVCVSELDEAIAHEDGKAFSSYGFQQREEKGDVNGIERLLHWKKRHRSLVENESKEISNVIGALSECKRYVSCIYDQ